MSICGEKWLKVFKCVVISGEGGFSVLSSELGGEIGGRPRLKRVGQAHNTLGEEGALGAKYDSSPRNLLIWTPDSLSLAGPVRGEMAGESGERAGRGGSRPPRN